MKEKALLPLACPEKWYIEGETCKLFWGAGGGGTVRGMAGGTGGGMVSLDARQTPQIDDNTPARGGIIMYNGGLAGV